MLDKVTKQKLVVNGNGMAGIRTVEALLERAPDLYDITVFGSEPYGNYNRILLSPVLAGEKTVDDIMLNIPTVPPVPGVVISGYHELIQRRVDNPRIGDTIRRLCLDGSNRQPIQFIVPSIADNLAQGRAVEGLALESALWCRYCAGTDEAGREIAPNDDTWDELSRRARAARHDPAAFLANRAVFGPLGDDAQLGAAFGQHLKRLWSDGVRAVLADYVG